MGHIPNSTRTQKNLSSNQLVRAGKHLARTVDASTLPQTLISQWKTEDISPVKRRNYAAFEKTLCFSPLIKRLIDQSVDGATVRAEIGAQLQKGESTARSQDTRSIKVSIIEWIFGRGEVIYPALSRTADKCQRGFNHPRTGFLLCPADLDWDNLSVQNELKEGTLKSPQFPKFLYEDYRSTPNDPWKSLLRSELLVKGFKQVFTSPSSASDEIPTPPTRPSNARLNNMTAVTPAAIAYIATLIRFSLSSQTVFRRSGAITGTSHEAFYASLIKLLEDKKKIEIDHLLEWWDSRIFPAAYEMRTGRTKNTVLAAIKARRAIQSNKNETSEATDAACN
ncbi:hypothetical protein BD410DRAFT_441511 [Rickenella mellea]|uniref:Uncharacterized protein n=1 Tax=Rickenella mellea TaxID=50990 RepID=A0A4Y7PY17_9AGAM|nr:hypothetical protein BD410DRAFT_441511 [Rickenella mellea]